MRYEPHIWGFDGEIWAIGFYERPSYMSCTLKLEPQLSEGFKDMEDGYQVDVVGECQGISDGVINLKINRIDKMGAGGIEWEREPW